MTETSVSIRAAMAEPFAATLRRSYVYRLEPTCEQAERLEQTLEACRLLFNLAVDQRRRALALHPCNRRGWLTWYDQKRELKELRPAAQAEGGTMALMDVPSIVCQDVLQRVDRAFQRWRTRDASGKRAGYPHYHRRGDYHSWTYAILGNGVSLREPVPEAGPSTARHGLLLRLFAIGDVRVRWHRPLRGTIKTITIKHESDGWYVVVSCADVPATPLPPTGKVAALDVRLASFATLDDGTAVGNPRLYEQSIRELRLAQRRLDRRKPARGQPPSAGYLEAKVLLAKAHQRVRRARAQFHHTAARGLVRDYDELYVEDLPVKTLLELREEEMPPRVRRTRNRGMADASWGNWRRILEDKAHETGRRVRAVNPAYTTRTCSQCGAVLAESVWGSLFACPSCGMRLPKAQNAARNILAAGRAADAGDHRAGENTNQSDQSC